MKEIVKELATVQSVGGDGCQGGRFRNAEGAGCW